jgi:hypothetical protein
LRAWAASAFFQFGGKASYAEADGGGAAQAAAAVGANAPAFDSSQASTIGRAIVAPTISFSGIHDGLVQFTARRLRYVELISGLVSFSQHSFLFACPRPAPSTFTALQ